MDLQELYRNFTTHSFHPITSPVSESIFLQRDDSLKAVHQEIRQTTIPASASEADYLYAWNEMGTLGFGIPDSLLATHIVNYCVGVVLVIIGLAGCLGNGLVLYVFTRYQRLRGGGGPLILSLASGDFIGSILHVLPAFSSFNNKWAFGSLGCSVYAASVGLCGIASLLTLTAIAADRFSVIIGRPLVWLTEIKTCVAIWLMSASLTFPPFFGWSRYCLEGLGTSCSWDYVSRDFHNRLYYIFLLTIGFVIPVSIITISYVGILWVVCKQKAQSGAASKAGTLVNKKKPTKNDVKTAQVVCTIIICFLLAWTPYAIVSLIGQFGDESKPLSPLATSLPAIFAKTSVIINPIVYGLSHPHFRSALRTLLRARRSAGKRYRSHHNITNKEYYQYNYNQSKYRNTPPMKHTKGDGACKGGGERLRRETRRQREMWKQQQSSSTKMMSDLTTTLQNNSRLNANMLLTIQDSTMFQKHLLIFNNPEKSWNQDVQSVSENCVHTNYNHELQGGGENGDSMFSSQPNLSTVSKKQVYTRIVLLEDKTKFRELSQGRKQLQQSLSRSENSLDAASRQINGSCKTLRSKKDEHKQAKDKVEINIRSCNHLHCPIRNGGFNVPSHATSGSTDSGLHLTPANAMLPKFMQNNYRHCGQTIAYKRRLHLGDMRSRISGSDNISGPSAHIPARSKIFWTTTEEQAVCNCNAPSSSKDDLDFVPYYCSSFI